MLERKKVRAANEDLPVIMEMNAASKMKLEKRMILCVNHKTKKRGGNR